MPSLRPAVRHVTCARHQQPFLSLPPSAPASHSPPPHTHTKHSLHAPQVRLELYDRKRTHFVAAHTSALAALALSLDGRRLATASDKGTLVRVWNTEDGAMLQVRPARAAAGLHDVAAFGCTCDSLLRSLPRPLYVSMFLDVTFSSSVVECWLKAPVVWYPPQELRRGSEPATIFSLALSRCCDWLAVSSDKGTVHVFGLAENVRTAPPEGSSSAPDPGTSEAASPSSPARPATATSRLSLVNIVKARP